MDPARMLIIGAAFLYLSALPLIWLAGMVWLGYRHVRGSQPAFSRKRDRVVIWLVYGIPAVIFVLLLLMDVGHEFIERFG